MGDKPSYYQWTGVLLRLFPDIRFVGIVRDPRTCVASLLRQSSGRTGSRAL